MLKRAGMASVLLLLLVTRAVLADEIYKTTGEFISHLYQKNDYKDFPWHKNRNGEPGVSDYSLCFNQQVSQTPLLYMIVMCPDMSKSTYANEIQPTDVFVLEKKEGELSLVTGKPDIGGEFKGVINIGSNKWAIHTLIHSVNQGYEQSHDTLQVFIKDDFFPITYWTSLLDNENAVDPDDAEDMKISERIESKLTPDDSQKDLDYYPLIIHATGYKGGEKVDKIYRSFFSIDRGEYMTPEDINGSY